MNKAIKAMPEDKQRNGRGFLLQKLNKWNYNNTASQADMIKRLGKGTLSDDDIVVTDVPDSLLKWSTTKNGVKTEYSYQMTPQEYHEYVTDYLKLVDQYRTYQGKATSNSDDYVLALSKTKTEVNKALKEHYKSKYQNKAKTTVTKTK